MLIESLKKYIYSTVFKREREELLSLVPLLKIKLYIEVAFGYMDFDLDFDFKSIDLKYLDSKSTDFKICCLHQFIQKRI
jgi:hypothetical protein